MLKKIISGLMASLFLGSVAYADTDILSVESSQKALVAGEKQRVYVKIAVRPPVNLIKQRTPVNLALVIDQSSSMNGDRIRNAQSAALRLIDLLSEEDTVSLVAFSSSSHILLSSQKMIEKKKFSAAIENLQSGGMTALYAGMTDGMTQVMKGFDSKKVNRIVLLSDGEANTGPSSTEELAKFGRESAGKGVSITTVGLGMGYNSELMLKMASASDGNHFFVENSSALENTFQQEFLDATQVVVNNVDIDITVAPGIKPLRILGYDGEIKGNRVTVKIPQLSASTEKYVLLEVELTPDSKTDKQDLVEASVSYTLIVDGTIMTKKSSYNVDIVTDKEAAEKTLNRDVMEKVILQIVAIETEEAQMEMVKGNRAAAKEKINNNKILLKDNAKRLNSPMLAAKEKVQSEYEADLSTGATDKLNKRMKQDSYNLKTQRDF